MKFATYHEARVHCKGLPDRDLWAMEDAEKARLGKFTPLNHGNPDHLALLAARDEHNYRKGNGEPYHG